MISAAAQALGVIMEACDEDDEEENDEEDEQTTAGANAQTPRSTGFCAIWDCISSSSSCSKEAETQRAA